MVNGRLRASPAIVTGTYSGPVTSISITTTRVVIDLGK